MVKYPTTSMDMIMDIGKWWAVFGTLTSNKWIFPTCFFVVTQFLPVHKLMIIIAKYASKINIEFHATSIP